MTQTNKLFDADVHGCPTSRAVMLYQMLNQTAQVQNMIQGRKSYLNHRWSNWSVNEFILSMVPSVKSEAKMSNLAVTAWHEL